MVCGGPNTGWRPLCQKRIGARTLNITPFMFEAHIEAHAHGHQDQRKGQSHGNCRSLKRPQRITAAAEQQGRRDEAFHACPEDPLR